MIKAEEESKMMDLQQIIQHGEIKTPIRKK
jgi:hypothetical protein